MAFDGTLTVIRSSKVERDDELEQELAAIWEDIVKHILQVLHGSSHGYEKFLELADPSIEQIINSITAIDDLMNKIFDGLVAGDVPVEVESKLIDCKQSIHLIRRVHVALKHDNQHEYDDVIRKLTSHSS